MSSIEFSSQYPGYPSSDLPILGELSGMWTIPGGEIVVSSRVSAATVKQFASWRSDEIASLSDHGVDCLMICSSDGQSAHTQVTLVPPDDGSKDNQQLASYRFGPSRQYKFYPSVPYTDELVDAMRSHWELVAGALSSDSTLLRQIRRSFEITELIKEVGDSFFAKATKPFRPGRTTRVEMFREKILWTVKDDQQELREPFRNQAGKISSKLSSTWLWRCTKASVWEDRNNSILTSLWKD